MTGYLLVLGAPGVARIDEYGCTILSVRYFIVITGGNVRWRRTKRYFVHSVASSEDVTSEMAFFVALHNLSRLQLSYVEFGLVEGMESCIQVLEYSSASFCKNPKLCNGANQ